MVRASSGEVFLVESKAHVNEMLSPRIKASDKSKIFINRSLNEVQSFLGINPVSDWSEVLYHMPTV